MTYTVTFHGLHCWYQAMFEKLGWMLLAQRDGYDSKIAEYKNGLKHLKEALEEKAAGMHDADKKEDLMVMHKNVATLMAHVSKDFKGKKRA